MRLFDVYVGVDADLIEAGFAVERALQGGAEGGGHWCAGEVEPLGVAGAQIEGIADHDNLCGRLAGGLHRALEAIRSLEREIGGNLTLVRR